MARSRIYPVANRTSQWWEDKYSRTTMNPVSKLLLHTTETAGWPAYSAGASAPSLTYNPWMAASSNRWRQHNYLDRSSRALRDPSGTAVRENQDGVVQVEIVCYCDPGLYRQYGKGVNALPDHAYEDLGNLLAFLNREWSVPLRRAPEWDTYPPSDSIRMTGPEYDAFTGVLGHQHASGNCVTADTPVLCADLTWRPAGDLLPGDELLAFDEEPQEQAGRRFRRATVTANELKRDALVRVNTRLGSVRCNREHPWLVRRGDRNKWGSWQWVPAGELQSGDEVMHVMEPWLEDRSWQAGWLAGMFDGEGSLSAGKQGGTYLSLAQRESPTADEMLRVLKEYADAYSIKRAVSESSLGTQPMVQATVHRRTDVLRVLGMVRPPRLLAMSAKAWEGGVLGKAAQRVAVDSIESYGTGTIAALSTSTHTYIAGGFAMHNTHGDPGMTNAQVDRILTVAKRINGGGSAPAKPPVTPSLPEVLQMELDDIVIAAQPAKPATATTAAVPAQPAVTVRGVLAKQYWLAQQFAQSGQFEDQLDRIETAANNNPAGA